VGLVAWVRSNGVTSHFAPLSVCAAKIAYMADPTTGFRCVATTGGSKFVLNETKRRFMQRSMQMSSFQLHEKRYI
jgi:hypothetical protein